MEYNFNRYRNIYKYIFTPLHIHSMDANISYFVYATDVKTHTRMDAMLNSHSIFRFAFTQRIFTPYRCSHQCKSSICPFRQAHINTSAQ